ncbi:MAG: hypothetical protein AB1649_18350 [Chloroflexota bacterium]
MKRSKPARRTSRIRIIMWLALLVAACGLPQAVTDTPLPTNLPEPTGTATPLPSPTPTATITSTPARTPMPTDQVWFGPNMGSTDFAELFTKPEQWAEARSRINVFKFHTQNVLDVPCAICGDNTLNAFVDVNAFRKLVDWGIAIDIDVGAVKEWGCNGVEEFRVAKTAIDNVQRNGGIVSFLTMDEPYMGGELTANGQTCGYTMEQSADVTSRFIRQIRAAYPQIIIGDVEPYPYFSVSELEQWISTLEANGTKPAFFHLDVNMLEGGRRPNVETDLPILSKFFQEHQIPFGVIFTSNVNFNPASDRAYFDATMGWIRTVSQIIGKPQQIVFNSWGGPALSGAHEIPINLPENDPAIYSHTRLILEGLAMFGE